MRNVLAFTALLLSVAACATTPKDPMERLSVEQLQQMGESYLAAGDVANALKFLTLAHEKSPNDPMILYELGLAYDERGLSDQALLHYQNALKLKPDFSDVHNAMGRLYAARGQLDKAQASFEEAFSNPFYGMPFIALYNLGLVYEKKNDPHSALQKYEEAIRLQPSYGIAHYRMGYVLEAMRRTDEARRAYGKAVQYSPDMAQAHLRYGVLSYNAGDLQNALYSLNRVLKLAPHTDMEEDARRYLAQLQSIMGPGSLRGGGTNGSDRFADMDILSHQELAYGGGRGMIPPPMPKMPPPGRITIPTPETSPPKTRQEVSPTSRDSSSTGLSGELSTASQSSAVVSSIKGVPSAAEKSVPVATGEAASASKEGPAEPPPVSPVSSEESLSAVGSSPPPPSQEITPSPETSSPLPPDTSPEKASALSPESPGEEMKTASRGPSDRSRWAYIVQVGSFLDRDNAEGVRKKLEKKGYSAVVKPFSHHAKGSIYVVQLTPVEDSIEATALLKRIESEEKLKPLIIKVPSNGQ